MPYAKNGDINIYYEVEGQGAPLVLAHPLRGSLGVWRRDGYVDALRNDYQLILFDARNRGQSDKSYEVSECYPSVLATDVLAILDELGITQTHYFGYSLGSRIGFWLAVHHPERFNSFILAGMTPYNIPEVAIKMVDDNIKALKLLKSDPGAYFLRREGILKRALSPEEKKEISAQDSDALIALWSAWVTSPGLSNEELEGITLPCLVFCGELDEGGFCPDAKEGASHIPNAKFVSFPELNHYQAGARGDSVLPYLKEFLAKVSKGVNK